MRRAGIVVWAVAVLAGTVATVTGSRWGDAAVWVPDVATGLILAGSAVAAWRRSVGTASLLGLCAVAWFLPALLPATLYWHRGVVIHLLVAYPGVRARGRYGWGVVIGGYLVSVTPHLWHGDMTSILLAVVLGGAVAGLEAAKTSVPPRQRRLARWCSYTLCAVVVAAAVARTVAARPVDVFLPTLLVYEAVLGAIAVVLAAGLYRPTQARVVDLVMELGEQHGDAVRDALARALGDPTLQVGYWDPEAGRYSDGSGRVLDPPLPGGPRAATTVERAGAPLALLVHDSAVLGDPALSESVGRATRLASANVALRSRVQASMREVVASRRRLVVAADEERGRLERRLRDRVHSRLDGIEAGLSSLDGAGGDDQEHLDVARLRLRQSRAELRDLAQGLRPAELDGGLRPALSAVADRSPVPVRLDVDDGRFPPEVESAAYYVCAEALANVVRHSGATSAAIRVSADVGVLAAVISDDGVGGADMWSGFGLRGLVDRVEALGGRLAVDSPMGRGTRVTAEIPLPAEA